MSNPIASEAIQPDEAIARHPAWHRLEDQLRYYGQRSQTTQRWHKGLKFVQLALAVSIPLSALLEASTAKWSTAIAGSLIALLEGTQQMNQYATLWVTYRTTAERLKQEKYLFLSGAGPYRPLSEAERLIQLAERVEDVMANEHTSWFNDTRQVATKAPAASPNAPAPDRSAG